LDKAGKLSVQTEVNNTGKGQMPLVDGWHPYFKLGNSIDSLQLEFQSTAIVLFDAELIPTGQQVAYQEFCALKNIGNQFFDHCFLLNFETCQPLCVLRNDTEHYQLEIYPDPSYPYLQIYTPPHRSSIALENLSAVPDAFNNGMGLITLAAGAHAQFSTAYKISLLP
jgi:aldose 1-epimerase